MTQVNFHLPNFVNMYAAQLNYSTVLLLRESPELFREGVRVASVFDSFPLIWNGGRIVSGCVDDRTLELSAPRIFEMFNELGVACRLTFSNPLIGPEHLDDFRCNRVLDLADNGLNGAIVCSDVLEWHIRRKHPNMPITSSTCKQLRDFDEISAELERNYSLVVLDYNVNRDIDLLRRLPHKRRCELLINAVCNPECPRRGEHYRFIGNAQLQSCDSKPSCGNRDWQCENLRKNVFERRGSKNYLSPEMLYETLVPLGYSHFKIEGRGTSILDLAEQYVYFMALPECRDVVRHRLLGDVFSLMKAMR